MCFGELRDVAVFGPQRLKKCSCMQKFCDVSDFGYVINNFVQTAE